MQYLKSNSSIASSPPISTRNNLVPSELNSMSTTSEPSAYKSHSLEFFVAVETSKPVVKSNSKILFSTVPTTNILVPFELKVTPIGRLWVTCLLSTNPLTAPKALKLVRKKINNKLMNFDNFTSYF